ncbi:MAG: hypothetical protein Q9188_003436 [Gyalolechia gomerana]
MSSSNAMQPQTSSAPPYDNDPVFEDEYNSLFAIQASMKTNLAPLFRENRRLQAIFLRVPESSISDDDIDVRTRIPPPNMHDLLPWKPSENSSKNKDEHKPMDLKQRNKMRLLHAMETDIRSMEGEIRELEWRNRGLRERLRTSEWRERNATVVIDLEDESEDEPMETVESVEDRERAMEIIRERAGELAQSVEDHRESSREMSKMNVEERLDAENSGGKGKSKMEKRTDEHHAENIGKKYKATVEEGTDEDKGGENHKKAAVAKMVPE